MEQSTIFKNNRSQAVRLPKALAFPDDVKKVDIVAIGRSLVITPTGRTWDDWFDGPGVTSDFMVEREQPPVQDREGF